MFFPGHTFSSARFTDNERKTIEVLLKVEGQDGFTPVSVSVDPKDVMFKELTKDIKLEDIHTNTDTQLLLERKQLANLFFKLGQKEGYIPVEKIPPHPTDKDKADAQMLNLIGADTRVKGGKPTADDGAGPVLATAVEQTIEQKIQDVIDYMFDDTITETDNKEDLFKLKLNVFENESIKNCKDRKLKAAVRKGATPKDVLLAAVTIHTTD
jgi:hypothetical protein